MGEGVESAKNLRNPKDTLTEITLKPKSQFHQSNVLKEERETKTKELQNMNDPIAVN